MFSTRQPPLDAPDLNTRFHRLDSLLSELAPLWRPQPFKQRRPAWCEDYPRLTGALLALEDQEYRRLAADEAALSTWLGQYLPAIAGLYPLVQVADSPVRGRRAEKHLDWEIPGRKWQQVDRFAQAIGEVRGPVVEWCGGKGHLGRVLALRYRVAVSTLERDAQLCEAGERLAQRAGVEQVFQPLDVLAEPLPALSGRHPVALHACGELHRRLLRRAIDERVAALDIAPCCYHLGSEQAYRPFTTGARLQPSREDLRLAVTGQATASARELRRRDVEMAWKLGFVALYQSLSGRHEAPGLRPVDKSWLKLGFEGFCRRLAAREQLAMPAGVDWSSYEAFGWQRQGEVMRLSLPRQAASRALEVWLVLDMALALEAAGFEVSLRRFCPRPISPRNLLISARRPQ